MLEPLDKVPTFKQIAKIIDIYLGPYKEYAKAKDGNEYRFGRVSKWLVHLYLHGRLSNSHLQWWTSLGATRKWW